MDCFFVSAERTVDNSLKGKPMVVANRNDTAIFARKAKVEVAKSKGAFTGATVYNKFASSKDWRDHFLEGDKVRGMAVAVSYEARSFGVKTGTTLSEALKMCPDLVIYPSNMPLYYALSQELEKLLSNEIPLLEQYSIDEFFGDLSGWITAQNCASFIKHLQELVLKRLDLPATIGVSSTKLLAKLAAKKAKPLGTMVVMPNEIERFVKDIDIRSVAGIGRKTADYLLRHGVQTLGDMKAARGLVETLGKNGKEILSEIEGISVKKVQKESPRKSVGISRTFDAIGDRDELKRRIFILARHLTFSLLSLDLDPSEFTISIKYQNRTKHQIVFKVFSTFCESELLDLIDSNLSDLDILPHEMVKYLGINAGKFAHKNSLDLFGATDEKKRTLTTLAQTIREKHGADMIYSAKELV